MVQSALRSYAVNMKENIDKITFHIGKKLETNNITITTEARTISPLI